MVSRKLTIIVDVPNAVIKNVEHLWPADTWNAVVARALRLMVADERQARAEALCTVAVNRDGA